MDHFVLGGVLDVLNKVKAWLVFFVEIYVGGIVVVAGVQVAVGVLISFQTEVENHVVGFELEYLIPLAAFVAEQSEVLAGDFHIAYFYGRGFVRKHGSGGGATH